LKIWYKKKSGPKFLNYFISASTIQFEEKKKLRFFLDIEY